MRNKRMIKKQFVYHQTHIISSNIYRINEIL